MIFGFKFYWKLDELLHDRGPHYGTIFKITFQKRGTSVLKRRFLEMAPSYNLKYVNFSWPLFSIAHCIAQRIDCAYLAVDCIDLEKVMPSKVNKANYKKGIQFPSKFLIRTCLPLIW